MCYRLLKTEKNECVMIDKKKIIRRNLKSNTYFVYNILKKKLRQNFYEID